MTIDNIKAFIKDVTEDDPQRKEKWVDKMYRAYLDHPHATDRHVGNVTFVDLYDYNSGVKVGFAKCFPTDTFNKKIGLAVAYARAIDAHVPDYI
jgi:hypothetical protein